MTKKMATSKGSILIGMIIVAVAMGLLIGSLAVVFKRASSQIEKGLWQDRLRWMAYDGYVQALDSVRTEYHLLNFDKSQKQEKWGVYHSTAIRVIDLPGSIAQIRDFENSVYVLVSASITSPSAPSPRNLELHLILDVPFGDPMRGQYLADLQDKVMMKVDEEMFVEEYHDDKEFHDLVQKLFIKIIMNALKYSSNELREFYTTLRYTVFPPIKSTYKDLKDKKGVFLLRPSEFYEYPTEIQVQFWREVYK